MGAGDSHRRGRTVALLEFANGCKLVYKPRSLQIEVHFQCLLEWLNGRGPQLALRTTKVLDRGSYGWCEFVQRETCSSIDELARFYTRQGEFLALLYMLEATDFHYENLIAAGEHPVLIDLESLFHPRSKQTRPKSRDVSGGTDDDQSVLRIGLLPLRLWNTDEHEGVDLSGLGSVEGQLTPREVIGWDGFGTDIMKVVRKRTEMAGGENRPLLNGNDVNTVEYVDAMVDGFTTTYEAILTHRETLLSKEGPLSWFLNDEVRFIFRPTLSYSLLLRESFHPDLLRDALYRDRFLDKIWNGMEGRHHQREIISAELADIHNNDVPMLTTRPNSRDLNTTSGETIRDFFEESGMNAVRRRLWNMNAEDLAAQVAVIRNSLSTLKGHGTGLKGLDTK
jgi:type 2 lantibiotic biosynthesis protein LanM